MSRVRCFLVHKTGNTIIEHRVCRCGNENCDAEYDITVEEWKRLDTGETRFGYAFEFGPGAMYFQPSLVGVEAKSYYWDNDGSEQLYVVCPNGHEWNIDSRASNCDRKEDRTHRCWIRHGNPPDITVDKNGNTCSAGAGSIRFGNNEYHGRLINGFLISEPDSQC